MTLPTGAAVTFLFTDIEGSTRLERAVGSAPWAGLVRRHDEILRAAIEGQHGVVVKTEGDAFFAAFAAPLDAITAAVAGQRTHRDRAVAGRCADPGPDGPPPRRGAACGRPTPRARRRTTSGSTSTTPLRIAAAGNGGQIVLSDALVATLPRGLTRLAGLADVELVDDGPRAVKDFEDPIPLYRLVVPGAADDSRALRTTEVPTNLPGEVTTLVGREDEIDRVRADLGASRIVTLAGPGGSGKTRLALAVAGAARDQFPHGVWFVDLAALRDPVLLEPAIAVALGVRETPDRTASEALRAHLRERTVLLVLDNLEQLLPAAAEIITGLVRGAPGLRALVTSRELLRVSGERGHPVPPLGVDAAVALFVDRARALRSDVSAEGESLAAIREICRRLDGLPLAIELAAARVRLFSPAAILERLGQSLDLGSGPRDTPERQRTLRGTFDWSYELLPDEERRLFAQARRVRRQLDIRDGNRGRRPRRRPRHRPRRRSRVARRQEPGPGRPRRWERIGPRGGGRGSASIRSFASTAWTASEMPASATLVEARFAAVCVGIAEAAGKDMLGPARETSMERLDRDDRNLRAAIDWTIASGEALLGLRLVGAIWRWYQARGRIREARAVLADLLARPEQPDVPNPDRRTRRGRRAGLLDERLRGRPDGLRGAPRPGLDRPVTGCCWPTLTTTSAFSPWSKGTSSGYGRRSSWPSTCTPPKAARTPSCGRARPSCSAGSSPATTHRPSSSKASTSRPSVAPAPSTSSPTA